MGQDAVHCLPFRRQTCAPRATAQGEVKDLAVKGFHEGGAVNETRLLESSGEVFHELGPPNDWVQSPAEGFLDIGQVLNRLPPLDGVLIARLELHCNETDRGAPLQDVAPESPLTGLHRIQVRDRRYPSPHHLVQA